MNLRSYVFFTLMLFGSIALAADKYQLKTFATDHGLSNNFIQSIAQDQSGFLWIATWDGLSRFDGYDFKNYYHKPDDPSSIPFFVIDKVLVDSLNQVWILCQGRPVMVLNRATDTFVPISVGTDVDPRTSDMALSPDQKMWIACGQVLFSYDIKTKQTNCVRPIFDNSTDAGHVASQITFDNRGGIWLYHKEENEYHIFKGSFGNDSILHIKPSGRFPISQFKSTTLHNSTGNFDFYISDSGKTWLFSKYGLFYFDDAKNDFVKNTKAILPEEFKGRPYFVWAEEKTGIQLIDTKTKTVTSLGTKSENFIETVFADQAGRIWSGDINQSKEQIGLNRYQKVPEYFRHYLTNNDTENTPISVKRILKDKENMLWAGLKHKDYLYKILANGTEEKIHFKPQIISKYQEIAGLAQDSAGVWVGTEGGQLIRYDYATRQKTCRQLFQNNTNNKPLNIQNMFLKDGDILINGVNGIYRFNPRSNRMDFYSQQIKDGTGFTLKKTSNAGFWLGTYTNTVIYLNEKFSQTATYRFGNGTNIVYHICEGDSNDIWVALMGGGIGHLYPASGKTEVFSTAEGLASNVTYSIVKDKRGNLWISTNQGLSRFNPNTRQFRNFGKEDGLLIADFNPESCFQAPDGEIFFGGTNGLVSFYPDSIESSLNKQKMKPLMITDFKVSGISRFFKKAIYETDRLSLRKGDDNFQITFACLDFQNPEKIKYRYRLANTTDSWTETNYRNRTISFANLVPGDYRFELEATDQNEEWNLKNSLLIIIPYKFHETKTFRFLVLFVLLLIVSGFVALFIKQIKLRERHKQDELKLESLRGQMNPHFIFNSLNSINYFISNNDKVSANSYIADFSRLIRRFLSNLSKDFIAFEKEIESLHDYLNLEHLRFGDKFDYSLNTDEIKNGDEILIFPGIVQPFIENAIWHGVRGLDNRKGFIRITFLQVNSDHIRCIIEDDGVGRKLSEEYKSHLPGKKSRGLGIIGERLKIISKMRNTSYALIIEDMFPDLKETGTRVTVDIPVKIIEQG